MLLKTGSRSPSALLAILLLTAGCGGAATDPLASYKAYVQNDVRKALEQAGYVDISDAISIDVVKSDSLVSPYAGTCVMQAVKKLGDSKEVELVVKIVAKHGLQDGRWVPTTSESTVIDAKGGNPVVMRKMIGRTFKGDSP